MTIGNDSTEERTRKATRDRTRERGDHKLDKGVRKITVKRKKRKTKTIPKKDTDYPTT